jgi:hypothetical protein
LLQKSDQNEEPAKLYETKTWHCPECGESLCWVIRSFRYYAWCCDMPWTVDTKGIPMRTWSGLPYPEKRISNYEEWKPRSKRERSTRLEDANGEPRCREPGGPDEVAA